VLASSARADDRARVLKHGDTFALFDHYGDVRRGAEQGLFHRGTRYLSQEDLRINSVRPLLLNSSVREDNSLFAIDLTNPDLTSDHKVAVARGSVHVFRGKTLWHGVCYEHLRLTNYGQSHVEIILTVEIDADFADIFEVRGWERKKRGDLLAAVYEERRMVLSYRGLDGVTRRTVVDFSRAPDQLQDRRALFRMSLSPHVSAELTLTFACNNSTATLHYDDALHENESSARRMFESGALIHTPSERFNAWLARSRADLHMLITETAHGRYPYAGVPWFSTAFGRDGIITALEYLWVDPSVAEGVLTFLAANQADAESRAQDSQPGKILHETREGELANLNEIPFGRYYGSVDSTPLFVMLAGAYFDRTNDRELIEGLWPNIERALEWIDHYGDADGDGFVEYFRMSDTGLAQQGWKDSEDSVFHADGTLARGPIALVEVQAYVYAAKLAAADIAESLGLEQKSQALRAQAQKLKDGFNRVFWLDDLGTFAIALDGAKNPCRVASSNAGHALFCGIAREDYAERTAESLLADTAFSGWGVRTIGGYERGYNPMSYHNGSVWPHDNALVAMGLARYGFKDKSEKILHAMFDASKFIELNRLPELVCGFSRRSNAGPTLYPVACSPQAWAAAAAFYLLQASLGITFKGGEVELHRPMLPLFLDRIEIRNLRVVSGELDLEFRGDEVRVLRATGHAKLEVVRLSFFTSDL
jgi:glycogen debranching enzyme